MRSFALMLGLPGMTQTSLILFGVVVLLAALLLGWLADLLLGDGAFGTAFNGVLLLAGALAGAILWRRHGLAISGVDPHAAAALAALGGGIACLLLLAVVRSRF